jgi:hypothetical protein
MIAGYVPPQGNYSGGLLVKDAMETKDEPALVGEIMTLLIRLIIAFLLRNIVLINSARPCTARASNYTLCYVIFCTDLSGCRRDCC